MEQRVTDLWVRKPPDELRRPVRSSLYVPPDHGVFLGEGITPRISPDGTRLVYGTGQLYSRELDRDEAHPIAGTEGGRSPFFSPDGTWLGFTANGKLKKVRTDGSGSGPVVLADAPSLRGASFGPDDQRHIVAAKLQQRGDGDGIEVVVRRTLRALTEDEVILDYSLARQSFLLKRNVELAKVPDLIFVSDWRAALNAASANP